MFGATVNILLLGTFMGLLTQPIFNLLGIFTGEQAIQYYAEVHQSKWNSFIHTLGMPFTYYGLLLCVPTLLSNNKMTVARLQLFFYPYFISYYMTLDFFTGILVALCYLPSQIYAIRYYYNSTNKIKTKLYGFLVATTALTIQEVFGHWLGGDAPSRIEAIPNAIWHSGFYSIWHLLS
tara:strand:- start:601 stop:1134 length:534 start_codon:yes stop_codon:yes gene_type:complete